MRSRFLHYLRILITFAFIIVVIGVLLSSVLPARDNRNQSTGVPSDYPVGREDAENLLARAVVFVRAGDTDSLCAKIAATEQNCRIQLDNAEQMGLTPGAEGPVITGVDDFRDSVTHSAFVLHVTGVAGDGRSYSSDFAVIRTGPNELRSPTSVYWADIKFSQ